MAAQCTCLGDVLPPARGQWADRQALEWRYEPFRSGAWA